MQITEPREGGRFGFTGMSPQLRPLFAILGWMKVFNSHQTLAEAVADGVWV